MRPEANQQPMAARITNTIERIRRVRSSSRCSRKDIWPPRSSSVGLLPERALRKVDMVGRRAETYNQSRLDVGPTGAGSAEEALAGSFGVEAGSFAAAKGD